MGRRYGDEQATIHLARNSNAGFARGQPEHNDDSDDGEHDRFTRAPEHPH